MPWGAWVRSRGSEWARIAQRGARAGALPPREAEGVRGDDVSVEGAHEQREPRQGWRTAAREGLGAWER
jgi:hypothetical protein